jgi:tetratricopeptide (TPR) repeat protein
MARFHKFDFKGDIQDQDEALRLNPHLGTAMLIKAFGEAALGELDKAQIDLAEGEAAESSPGRAHRLSGDFYRYIGNYDRAIEEYGLAIALSPNSAAGHGDRGICYLKIQQLQNALEDLRKCVDLKPTSTALSYLALVEEQLGDKQKADADILRAFNTTKPISLAYSNRGAIRLSRGDASQALADAKKALLLNPYDGDAYHLLSLISSREGKAEESQKYASQAKKYGYPNAVPRIGW